MFHRARTSCQDWIIPPHIPGSHLAPSHGILLWCLLPPPALHLCMDRASLLIWGFMFSFFLLRTVGSSWTFDRFIFLSAGTEMAWGGEWSVEKAAELWDCFSCSGGKRNSKCWVTQRVKFGSEEWIGCGNLCSSGNFELFCIAVNDLTWVCVRSNPREGESRDDFCEGSACSLPQEV